MAFATLTMCQLFHAFNVRSEEQSLFRMGPLSNPAMVRAFVTGMLLQLAVLLPAAPAGGVLCAAHGRAAVAGGAPSGRSAHPNLRGSEVS